MFLVLMVMTNLGRRQLLRIMLIDGEQVRSDNGASEVGILGHFRTFWDIMAQFGRLYDEVGAFGPFS